VTWDNLERVALILIAGAGIVGWIAVAARRGGFQAASEAAAGWKSNAEAQEAKVAQLEARLSESESDRSLLTGRVDELSTANEQMRALLMGESVPDALGKALNAISDGVIEYFDQLMAGFNQQMGATLKIQTALLATMESEYLAPILSRLERRSTDEPFEGKDRREDS
jgi:hypothetical protein